MKRHITLMACGLIGIASGATALALVNEDQQGSPYHGIVERNVFNLKPPAPVVPPETPAPPPPKIKLNGIFTILGGKRAGLTVSVPAKPPEPAKEDSFILSEGQRKGDVEVMQIDEVAGMVRLNNHGTIQSLNFTNDGAKLVNVPTPMHPPGSPQMNSFAQPGQIPPPGSPIRTIPPRAMRLPPTPGMQQTSPQGGPQGAPGFPGGPQGGAFNYQQQQQQPVPPAPEYQAAAIEVQRARYQNEGNPMANLLPPTPVTQQIQTENGGPPPPQFPQFPPPP